MNLRHLRDVAARGGLAAAGFRLKAKELHQVLIPAITRVTIHGYDHFVVFREARGGRVYVADPAFGNTSYRLRAFDKIWSGVMMGFARRTGDRPVGHDLSVLREDEVVIEADKLTRLAAARVIARVPRPLSILNSSGSPFEGLDPVFPSLRATVNTF